MVTVFMVDDHEIARRGLKDLLDSDPELTVIGEADSVTEALARIEVLRPEVAVLDVSLPDGNGIELCRDLLSRMDGLRCLILTAYSDEEAVLDAVLAGAAGYVVKDIKGLALINAVKQIGAGQSLLDHRAAAALMRQLRRSLDHTADPLAALTDRERMLLDLLGEGMTNRQISERMCLAEKTVKNYVSHLLAKLGLERRAQAAVYVTRLNASARL
ncbi:response regulator [Nocardia terpenica]|uniref:DNA-binding response regulator n=1 Tax=Nocardia terpenica TaxID=455432 RepID=A0A291RQ02_9NOCA|nr:response regulator transcription factor [Nocardia terpenica]ATL69294.1 DNA-binding response regulator [Nocardia terpenica]